MNCQLLPALSCLLACALAAGAAQAQIAPTRSEIRLWEQEGNVVIPPERRLYSTRFDAGRSRFIGMAIALSHAPANASAIFPVDCELRAPGGNRPSSQKLHIEVATGSDESSGVALWKRAGNLAWAPGNYLVHCSGPLPSRDQRDYMTRFPARKTSRIGVALELTHSPPGGAVSIPVECYYYPPGGQAMGPINFNYEPQANATSGNAGLAMG